MKKHYKGAKEIGMRIFFLIVILCIFLVVFFLFRNAGRLQDQGESAGEVSERPDRDELSLTEEERNGKDPLFLQTDERWKDCPYGNSTIEESGCAPSCLAMAAVALTRNKKITPQRVAAWSEKNGYYEPGQGSLWTLIPEGSRHFGLTAEELPLSEERMEGTLDAGGKIICALGPGDFTTEGHFIEIYQYSAEGFSVHDPNSVLRSRRLWKYDDLRGQIRNLWGISR